MRPIKESAEKVVIELLEKTGPCLLDDLVMQLPNFSWSDVIFAVDRMSRDGRLFLRCLARSTYYVALPSQHACRIS
jgi:hypothetical protein